MSTVEIRHFHLFAGLGGGAAGFNRGEARVGSAHARFRCIGGIDVLPSAVNDFGRLAGVPGTLLDLFDREQYRGFHGHEPPAGWREATPTDIRRAAGSERPHIVFTSPPCKGFSGLLSESRSRTHRYQTLNRLTIRGIWLTLEAWADDPPEFVLLENVPRIANRGRHLLDQITQLLNRYGYAVAETTHDCGELGGLAQSRRRFLLVARHTEKVPPFLYEPHSRPLRAVGDVLGRMPLPGDHDAGPMHRIPSLQWKTWVRLALIEAGNDWRSLQRLRVIDGVLADFAIAPEQHGHVGVCGITYPRGSVAGQGAFSVIDPRFAGTGEYGQYGVRRWAEPTGTVTGQRSPGQGAFSVADPRIGFDRRRTGDHYLTGGHYGVVSWGESCGAVSGAACHDNGRWSIADPRTTHCGQHVETSVLPATDERLIAVIRALDGTWHRPFTTLELAVLQGLIEPNEHLELAGLSDSDWRERIGNAVPPPAATAIASVMGTTLLLAWSGETFMLSNQPIWVKPMAVALATAASV